MRGVHFIDKSSKISDLFVFYVVNLRHIVTKCPSLEV